MLGFELVKIGEARRIDQLQPVEVASQARLFGGGGEQQ